jgi:hypothetical protein
MVVGADGKPLAGARVLLSYERPVVGKLHAATTAETEVAADATGAFRIDTVFPGAKFGFDFRHGDRRYAEAGKDGWRVIDRHGGTLDLGEIKVQPAPPQPDGGD